MVIARVGQRGVLVLPKKIRDRLGVADGSLVILEFDDGSVNIRPAVATPVERYSPRRKAAMLLNAAIDQEDYDRARDLVRGMGLDPDSIPHEKPD